MVDRDNMFQCVSRTTLAKQPAITIYEPVRPENKKTDVTHKTIKHNRDHPSVTAARARLYFYLFC